MLQILWSLKLLSQCKWSPLIDINLVTEYINRGVNGKYRFAYLLQRRMNKEATEIINILECLSLYPAIFFVSKVSGNMVFETQNYYGKKMEA